MSPERIRRAVEVLREEAECLRQSHKGASGDWFLAGPSDRRAKRSHDEMLALADELEALAEKIERPSVEGLDIPAFLRRNSD